MISYTSMRQRILASLIIAGQLAAQSVVVPPYWQKLATFYAPGDARVPSALSRASRTATASDGASWTASTPGLLRSDPRAAPRDRTQYFAGRRYLPDDEALALAPDNEAGMWVRTRTGVVHIELRRMTLEAKAALFETRIRERHDRYGLVASSTLAKPGDLSSNQLSSDDNDGLWTAMYASAECFRYAATHDPEALARAVRSTNAVLFLEQVTGRPGFPARSYIRKGDPRPPANMSGRPTPVRMKSWATSFFFPSPTIFCRARNCAHESKQPPSVSWITFSSTAIRSPMWTESRPPGDAGIAHILRARAASPTVR